MHEWRRHARAFGLLTGIALALACGGEQESASKPVAQTPAGPTEAERAALRAEAGRVFADKCARCHGVGGAGNGIESDQLVPRPRNFQDPGWQRSVKNSYLEKIILEGGEAAGKAASMPAFPELGEKPGLVRALRIYIRNLSS